MPNQRVPMIGREFGSLRVLEQAPRPVGSKNALWWKCQCVCGAEVVRDGSRLRYDETVADCGDRLKHPLMQKHPNEKHGHAKPGRESTEYRSWRSMLTRCNPKHDTTGRYAGRGIVVCARWQGRNGFERFLADMGPKPTPGHTIERKNNDGNYEPSNCVWATQVEQQNNRSSNRHVTIDGETKTMAEWARQAGQDPRAVKGRMRHGWSLEEALTRPFARRAGHRGVA